MCCLHKTYKVRLLILHDKNFLKELKEKAMPKTAELGRILSDLGRIW